jgi:hypothetical protein
LFTTQRKLDDPQKVIASVVIKGGWHENPKKTFHGALELGKSSK